jgi:hypothetical protein
MKKQFLEEGRVLEQIQVRRLKDIARSLNKIHRQGEPYSEAAIHNQMAELFKIGNGRRHPFDLEVFVWWAFCQWKMTFMHGGFDDEVEWYSTLADFCEGQL